MATLTSTTVVFHNSLQRQYTTSQCHIPLLPSASQVRERLPVSSFPSPGSVKILAAKIQGQPAAANTHISSAGWNNIKQSSKPNEMVQLIKLRLQPSEPKRYTFSLESSERSTAGESCIASSSEGIELQKPYPSPKAPALPPCTREEWDFAMGDIETLFGRRQYKQCTVKAKEILEIIREPVSAPLSKSKQI